ncbi:FAD-dependent oxidoreductase [Streptomyces termitum]|uniref:Oxidoreductase n=1 Tax=Streptomyces termitum TaxID=67368 RepID=A0A918T389_9ACTN|nr:FAD-dependent oxidoreductase [Streptomyces termitum]GHA86679.1 oxidoreductase [Streptomyces termitum]
MNGPEPTERAVDVLVVGAGPAGLAAAARLAAAGAGRVEVLERDAAPGGLPRLCPGTGFGADARGRPLDGPGHARRAVGAAVRAGAALRTGVSATGWAAPLLLEVTAPTGPETVRARAVVLATGARERSRAARLLPGTRAEGVFTTGGLLRTLEVFGPRPERIGRRAVVLGDDPAARHAVRLLRGAGVAVAAVVCPGPRAAVGAVGAPVLAETAVTELTGRGRLASVVVRGPDGRSRTLACDTLVLTGDWVAEHDVARAAGLPLAPGGRGPVADGALRTTAPGVFAAGGLLGGGGPAVRAAAEGRAAAGAVLAFLAGRASGAAQGPPVVAAGALARVRPDLLGPEPGPLLVRAGRVLVRPVLTVAQDGRVLRRDRLPAALLPWRPLRLGPEWTRGADPDGGPVEVGADDGCGDGGRAETATDPAGGPVEAGAKG